MITTEIRAIISALVGNEWCNRVMRRRLLCLCSWGFCERSTGIAILDPFSTVYAGNRRQKPSCEELGLCRLELTAHRLQLGARSSGLVRLEEANSSPHAWRAGCIRDATFNIGAFWWRPRRLPPVSIQEQVCFSAWRRRASFRFSYAVHRMFSAFGLGRAEEKT